MAKLPKEERSAAVGLLRCGLLRIWVMVQHFAVGFARSVVFAVAVGALAGWSAAASAAPASPAAASAPASSAAVQTGDAFTVRWDGATLTEPYTGRVYVVMSTGRSSPRQSMSNWFRPPTMFVKDVVGAKAGEGVVIKPGASGVISFPAGLTAVPEGQYKAQALLRLSKTHNVPGEGAGDLFSDPVSVAADAAGKLSGELELRPASRVAEPKFRESARVKLMTVRSELLSGFHKFEYQVKVGVQLPADWSEEKVSQGVSWPVVYLVSGFGGDHGTVRMAGGKDFDGCLVVCPDATNHDGHSVFADSANCGPWGRFFVEELIPAVEGKYSGAIAQGAKTRGSIVLDAASARQAIERTSSRRFVTGVSSGGWSSLWLVVSYPFAFDSCWSHVPDPVDFRDFQRIDLYANGANMYRDENGNRRGIARRNGAIALYYDVFVAMETALGDGGQIHSFEAVFSPRGSDGKPARLFDRETGAIDPTVAEAWKKYDIGLILRSNWKELGPKLRGKIHVFAGEEDSFYLDGAARLLKKDLAELGSDAEVVIVPGMGHTLSGQGQVKMLERVAEREAEGREAAGREK